MALKCVMIVAAVIGILSFTLYIRLLIVFMKEDDEMKHVFKTLWELLLAVMGFDAEHVHDVKPEKPEDVTSTTKDYTSPGL